MNPDEKRRVRILIGIAVAIVGAYVASVVIENRRVRLAAEAEQRALEQALAIEQSETIRKMQDDLELVDRLVSECLTSVRRRRNSIFSLSKDTRDVDEVRRLLKNLHPYDIASKLRYVQLEQMDEQTFMKDVADRAVAREAKTGETSIDFAVTYVAEGFAGMKDAWGILKCPLHGSGPGNAEIDLLYIE